MDETTITELAMESRHELQDRIVKLEAENKKLRTCGVCKHAQSTSFDHLRCYGRGTPYEPVGRLFACNNFKALKDDE